MGVVEEKFQHRQQSIIIQTAVLFLSFRPTTQATRTHDSTICRKGGSSTDPWPSCPFHIDVRSGASSSSTQAQAATTPYSTVHTGACVRLMGLCGCFSFLSRGQGSSCSHGSSATPWVAGTWFGAHAPPLPTPNKGLSPTCPECYQSG
jgi:hypothetical protein